MIFRISLSMALKISNAIANIPINNTIPLRKIAKDAHVKPLLVPGLAHAGINLTSIKQCHSLRMRKK